MSKELEALERVKEYLEEIGISKFNIHTLEAIDDDINCIKQAIEQKEQQAKELRELKKDITRFLYLQTGRIPFTGEFTQDFVIENKSHPLAHISCVERNLKKEYKELKEKIELLGEDDE